MTDDGKLIEQVAELQLAAFLAGRGSVTGMKNGTRVAKPAPSMDDFRRMAQSAILPIIKAIKAENERLRGYAVHDPACLNVQPEYTADYTIHFPHPCTCGLTALLKEIEGD